MKGTIECPYCHTRQKEPPDKRVGTDVPCLYCRKPFHYTGLEFAPVRPLPQEELPRCNRCGGELILYEEGNSKGMGCLLVVIGLCFTIFLIGIPVAIYGMVLMGKKKEVLWCKQCGTKYPPLTQ